MQYIEIWFCCVCVLLQFVFKKESEKSKAYEQINEENNSGQPAMHI